MIGAGKYDDLCSLVRELTSAEATMLLVFRGDRGSGFSVQALPELVDRLPEILREAADQIERGE